MKVLQRYHAVMAIGVLSAALAAASCETGSIYRGIPPRTAPERLPPPPPDYYPPRREEPPPPQTRAPAERPLREEDLGETPRPAPRPVPPQEDYSRTPPPAPSTPPPALSTPPTPPPLPDDSSLLAKITPSTPPQRAVSLRLTEEGRKLLEAGDASRALGRLEKTIAIDSTNPYGYYFLAKAQHALGRYQESLRFLDVAEPLFGNNPFWLAELYALRGENYRALGSYERAESNYTQALRFNSGNKVAADGLSRVQAENGPALR